MDHTSERKTNNHPPPSTDVERILFAFRALDLHLKVASGTHSQFSSKQAKRDDSDDDDSEDDQAFVGGGKRSGIRKSVVRGGRDDDDDDEFDL